MQHHNIVFFSFLLLLMHPALSQESFLSNKQNTNKTTYSNPQKKFGNTQDKDEQKDKETHYDASFQRCEAGIINLSISGAQVGEYYMWIFDNRVIKTSLNNTDNSLSLHVNKDTYVDVKIIGSSGVRLIKKIKIIVSPNPHPYITADKSTSVCAGERVILNAFGGNLYLWSAGVSILKNDGSTVKTDAINQSSTFTVTVYNEFGCRATSSIALSTLATPPAPTVETNQTRCGKGKINLKVSGSTGKYRWYSDYQATTPSSTSSVYPVEVDNSHTYFVTAVGNNGCESLKHAAITTAILYPIPDAPTVSIEEYSICKADSLTIQTNPINLNNHLEWYKEKELNPSKISVLSSDSQFTSFIDKSETIFVRLVNNYTRCASPPTPISIQFNAVPLPTNPNNPVMCEKGLVTFQVDSVPNIQYNWYTSENDSRPIASGGNDPVNKHSIKRMVSEVDDKNQFALWCEMIDLRKGCVSPRRKITAHYQPLPTIQLPENVLFCTQVSQEIIPVLSTNKDLEYRWYSIDRDTQLVGTSASLSVYSEFAKRETIGLVVRNTQSNCASGIYDHLVHLAIIAGPKRPILSEEVSCGTTIVKASGACQEESYVWKDFQNSIVAKGCSIVLPAGLMQGGLSVEINNSKCPTQTIYHQPRFEPLPDAPELIAPTSMCAHQQTLLEAKGAQAGNRYQWYNQENTPINGANFSVYQTPVLETSSTYYVSVITNAGCEGAKSKALIQVFNTPQIKAPLQSCPGQLIELKGTNATLYNWYENGAYIGSGQSLYVSPSTTSTFSLVDISNTSSCNTASVTVFTSFKNCPKQTLRNSENESDQPISVLASPNPFVGTTAVELKKFSPGCVAQLLDAYGKELFSMNVPQSHFDIGESIPSGIFTLRIRYADGTSECIKLIKQ